MKKILLATTLSAASLFGVHLYDNTDAVVVAEPAAVNEVSISTVRTDFAASKVTALAMAQYIYSGDFAVVNIPAGYNIDKNIGIEGAFPIVQNTSKMPTGKDEMGIGDITIGANYHFGSYSSSSGFNMTTLRYKSTTGDENKGLGTGEASYTLSHNYAKDVGSGFRVHAMAAYTLNGGEVVGDAINAMVGASRTCVLEKDYRTNVKMTFLQIQENDYDSNGVNSIDIWLDLSSKKMPLNFGIKVPLINETSIGGSTVDADKTILLYVGAGSFF
jgi:hypothetical protein